MTMPCRSVERGASAVEYGLLVSGIAAVIAVAVYAFGGVAGEVSLDSCKHITSATGTTISTSCE
ncbi:Flp family type IVb pilin [Nocardioides sp. LHG3406-4]|uniref:Flp family type IVb pilin n=1 Tax=Nocardioides sp. LHG3406-4 TaxID=2804575 RepID=UPI003CE69200